MISSPKFRALPLLLGGLLALACSDDGTTGPSDNGSGGGIGVSSGGSQSSGGSPTSGGATGSGGAGAQSSGGAASGGTTASGGGQLGCGENSTDACSGGQPGAGGAGSGGEGSGGTLGDGGGDGSGGQEGTGGAGSGGDTGTGGATATFEPCPGDGSACKILPLGDSITEGFGSSGGGYRVELFRQALQNDKAITFVGSLINGPNTVDGQPFPRSHEGHGGWTIDSDGGHSGISGQVTQNALSNYGPHIVLLMIGTNDINGNVDVANAPARLGNLIDDITNRSPDALVMVASCVPIVNDGTNQKIVTYNSGVRSVVEERAAAGKHVEFVDNYEAIHSANNWKTAVMGDNLHPNDAGYAILGATFYDAIAAYLP